LRYDDGVLGAPLVALLQTFAAVPAPAAPVMAVFTVRDERVAKERASATTLQSMTTYLASLLTGSKAFRVVPSSDLQRALQDTKRESYQACYDERCQIEIGKAVAAALSLDTRIGRVGSSCVVTADVYDLREEASTQAASARGACTEDALTNALEQIVQQLVGGGRAAGATAAGAAAPDEAAQPAPLRDHARQPPLAPRGEAATRAAFGGSDAEWQARLTRLSTRLDPDALQLYVDSGQPYEPWATAYNDASESAVLEVSKWVFTGLSAVALGVLVVDSSARSGGTFWLGSGMVAFGPTIVTWSFDLADIGDVPTTP
jgi:hypothetical protein